MQRGDSENSMQEKSSSAGLIKIFSKFADKTSLNGVPFINSTHNLLIKAVWSCLLAAAIGAMFFHLYNLFITYLSFGKHSQISLGFSTLDFPAVTICNVNMMRMSHKKSASREIQELIEKVSPDKMLQQAKQWKPTYEDDDDVTTRRKSTSSSKMRSTNFLDDFNTDSNMTYLRSSAQNTFYAKKCDDCWEGQSESSTLYQNEEQFRDLFSFQNKSIRSALGHQIQDMMLQCSFAGRKCVQSNFTQIQSAVYGNCYTIEYDKFVARKSGPSAGLELTLFLETSEYIPGITNGKGLQLVVHEQGTVPFPEDEGIAINPGTQTLLGLRMACQRICEQQQIIDTCQCVDALHPQLIIYMNATNVQPCNNITQMVCVTQVEFAYNASEDKCGCASPCSESLYEKTISPRQWPSPSFASILVESICQDRSPETCSGLRNMSDNELLGEFVKLNIFFEDLNYEELSEQADYTSVNLLSDIGGTIGLWIGLSVLSLFELIHLMSSLVYYIMCGRWRAKEDGKYGTD
ncbi:degenerin unc-8-like [Physella acuta]|uniref:degenerin unc-8-like n=1 Tax=Physella acuta TaxID=109671 RepID=UPI0027DAB7FA|nr:degenerin unc-8-like [Physella acuta]